MELIQGYRLSPAQAQVWRAEKTCGASLAVSCRGFIQGHVDDNELMEAVKRVIHRYGILRAHFRMLPGMKLPLQVVSAEREASIRIVETPERGVIPNTDFEDFGPRHFDLQNGPVVFIELRKLSEQEYDLLLKASAVCADIASLRIIVSELATELARDQDLASAQSNPPVVDYIALGDWLHDLAYGESTLTEREYWRGERVGKRADAILPFEQQGIHGEFCPNALVCSIPAELSQALSRLSRSHSAELPVILLTCWQILLFKLTKETELVIGLTCDGRTDPELSAVVGPLERCLPITCHVDDSCGFRALVEANKESFDDCVARQEYFNWEEYFGGEVEMDGRKGYLPIGFGFREGAKEIENERGRFLIWGEYGCGERFKLKANFVGGEDGLRMELHYDGNVLSREAMGQIYGYFGELVERILEDEGRSAVGNLELLSKKQRRQILEEFSGARMTGPLEYVHRVIEGVAATKPEEVALVDGERSLTYRQLNGLANGVARRLKLAGVGPEKAVGIVMEPAAEMVIAMLGVLKAGGVYVPIDPGAPRERVEFMMRDVGARVLLSQQHLQRMMTAPRDCEVMYLGEGVAEMVMEEEELKVAMFPGSLAYVIYTSGSTGTPKGTMVTHEAFSNHMQWMQGELPLRPDDRVLQKTAFTFDGAVWEFYGPLMVGGQLILAGAAEQRDTKRLVDLIAEHGITVVGMSPSLLRVCLEEEHWPKCQSLRRVYCGGEVLNWSLEKKFHKCSQAELHNFYGPTEATMDTTHCLCRTGVEEKNVSIGRPITNVQVLILGENLELMPVGVSGEICIGGLGLARGYHNRVELTAEKFIPHPFSKERGQRLYRSGDLGLYNGDGTIQYLGRKDRQVKVRGFRIELEEIESVLGNCPAVKECAVKVHDYGEEDKRLIGYVVIRDSGAEGLNVVREHLKTKLPEYMVPSSLVTLEKMPVTSSGKVDVRALPVPRHPNSATVEVALKSRTPVEEVLQGIWSQVLHVEHIGIGEDFFELGGHSLLATQLMSRVRDALGVDLPLRSLFEAPTIEEFARQLEQRRSDKAAAPAKKIERRGAGNEVALSYAQERIWFLDQFEPESAAYNVAGVVRVTGALREVVLERALNEIIRRHEVLRTNFILKEEGARQIIHGARELKIETVDMRGVGVERQWEEVRRVAREEAEKVFDLSKDLLLRVKVVQLGEEERVVFYTMHHIVSDGWSMGILMREVAGLYEAYQKGAPSSLRELEIQYADFAVWQRAWLQGEVLEEQLEYWKRQLAGAPEVLELPLRGPRPAVPSYAGATHTVHIPQELSRSLKELTRREGATLFMTLLASFVSLLYRYTYETDIVVGTVVANRNRRDLEDLIGFFVNTLAIRVPISAEATFIEVLRLVRETTLAAYSHQDLPFELLVEKLQPTRNTSHAPVFQVMFLLDNAPEEEMQIGGLSFHGLGGKNDYAKFDLTMSLRETRDGITGVIGYRRNLFEHSFIEGFAASFQMLLEGLVREPKAKIGALNLLSKMQVAQLFEWGKGPCASNSHSCIHEVFDEIARKYPQKVAVISNECQFTYEEVNNRATRIARYLQKLGVGPEVPVGIRVERSMELVVGLFAILKAGGAYVPLDPGYPEERLEFILRDAGVQVVLTQKEMHESVALSARNIVYIDDSAGWVDVAEESAEHPLILPDNLAYIIYTSGSTGRPKGVMVTHRGLSNYVRWAISSYRVAEGSGTIVHSSIAFDLTITGLFPPLLVGQTVVLIHDRDNLDELAATLKDRKEITLIKITPAHLVLLRELVLADHLNNNVRRFVIGGENLTAEGLGFWSGKDSAARLINEYGPTETVVGCCAYEVEHLPTGGSIPIGKPISNTSVFVLDENFESVPVGVAGQLYISGDGLARGYQNQPAGTAAMFVPNPFGREPGMRLYRTGDWVKYLPNGELEFLGRRDQQVKLRGHRIELAEVERVLGEKEGVLQAVVVLEGGKGDDRRLIAYVVMRKDTKFGEKELKDFARKQLPEYMVPSIIVAIEELPLTPNGKVNREKLPALQFDCVADPKEEALSPEARLLKQIWEKLLGRTDFGPNDNFFQLGGHSLMAVQLRSRIRSVFHKDLPLMAIFQRSTIREIAEAIKAQDVDTKLFPSWSSKTSPLIPIQPAGLKPPLFLVHPASGNVTCYLDFAKWLGGDQPLFGFHAPDLLEVGKTGEAYESLEEMARDYINAMTSVISTGPYLIGGWSYGAYVAFEMAQQLVDRGERVDLLALIDVASPRLFKVAEDRDDGTQLMEMLEARVWGTGIELNFSAADLTVLAADEKLAFILERLKIARLIPANTELDSLQQFMCGVRRRESLLSKYTPRVYKGEITLFRARDFDSEIRQRVCATLGIDVQDRTTGWSDLCDRTITVIETTGNHLNLVFDPNAETLARLFAGCIDKSVSLRMSQLNT